MKRLSYFIFLILFLLPVTGFSATEDVPPEPISMEEFINALTFQSGVIVLENGLVTLNLTDEYRYLSPEDTERVLVEAWGNPKGNPSLGMVVPAGVSIFDPESWAALIQYEEDGYVSDDDAESIDYEELLENMKASSADNNKAREEAGYEPIHVVGWAAAPYYDGDAHKLHWAKELKFGDSEENTLNYNIRILGRKGVLVVNIISGMNQFYNIDLQIPALLSMAEFNPGNKYSDFDPKLDKVAAYGVGALVAGKVATKVGLLAKLGGILLAMKKFGIIILLAIGAFIKKIFFKGSSPDEE